MVGNSRFLCRLTDISTQANKKHLMPTSRKNVNKRESAGGVDANDVYVVAI